MEGAGAKMGARAVAGTGAEGADAPGSSGLSSALKGTGVAFNGGGSTTANDVGEGDLREMIAAGVGSGVWPL